MPVALSRAQHGCSFAENAQKFAQINCVYTQLFIRFLTISAKSVVFTSTLLLPLSLSLCTSFLARMAQRADEGVGSFSHFHFPLLVRAKFYGLPLFPRFVSSFLLSAPQFRMHASFW